MVHPALPRCSYRIQLGAGLGLAAAAELAGPLAGLGISHMYVSPVLQARPGSAHGYDVVDHSRVSEELGGLAGLETLVAALRYRGLGLLLDIVPNHMAVDDPSSRWWWDVLENGHSSRYALHFDINWDPPEVKLREKILVPVLADHYGRELESGRLRVERGAPAPHGGPYPRGRLVVRYGDRSFPFSPHLLDAVAGPASRRTRSRALAAIASDAPLLPVTTGDDQQARERRHADKERLWDLFDRACTSRANAAAVDEAIAALNASVDLLDAILQAQHYRLAFWRTSAHELDYRRFFDINELAALRVEDERVFDDVHGLVVGWARRGVVDGLRIDHVDGLRDPLGYLRRLRGRVGTRSWLVVEKILSADEELRSEWPVAGSTGYDFAALVGGLFVDPRGESALTSAYQEFTGDGRTFADVAYESRREVLRGSLAADVARVVALLARACERQRRFRDFTRAELLDAVRELASCFPAYRSYVRAETEEASAEDLRLVDAAVAEVARRRPDIDEQLLGSVGTLLRLERHGDQEHEFATRFQQLCATAMAKGVEDTALYRCVRLAALNEVGADPSRFGTSIEAFHRANAERRLRWPRSLLALSTHDTKRSADVRARLAVISEMPKKWSAAVRRWAASNERHRSDGWPDRTSEWLFYQTVIGAHPLETRRAVEYMRKAAREEKRHTSWTTPNEDHERALQTFVEGALGDAEFRADLEREAAPVVAAGRVNSLAQTLLQLTSPGVPDIYQGGELWDLSLVDPDNRRPVDWAFRERLIAEVPTTTAQHALARADEGLPKLFLTQRTLALRARRPELLDGGAAYEPLETTGEHRERLVGFVRAGEVVTLVPRLVLSLAGEWGDTRACLPRGRWRDELSGTVHPGEALLAGDAFARFPVALLLRQP